MFSPWSHLPTGVQRAAQAYLAFLLSAYTAVDLLIHRTDPQTVLEYLKTPLNHHAKEDVQAIADDLHQTGYSHQESLQLLIGYVATEAVEAGHPDIPFLERAAGTYQEPATPEIYWDLNPTGNKVKGADYYRK